MSRPKVAFFDFTSCEGCQLSKLNLEEDLLGILELVELGELPGSHLRPPGRLRDRLRGGIDQHPALRGADPQDPPAGEDPRGPGRLRAYRRESMP